MELFPSSSSSPLSTLQKAVLRQQIVSTFQTTPSNNATTASLTSITPEIAQSKLLGFIQRQSLSNIRLLFLKGALPNQSNYYTVAIDRGNLLIIQFLLIIGCHINGLYWNKTQFYKWLANEQRNEGISDISHDNTINNNDTTTTSSSSIEDELEYYDPITVCSPLHIAITSGNTLTLQYLLTISGNLPLTSLPSSILTTKVTEFPDTVLPSLTTLDVNTPLQNSFDDTPLHTACLLGLLPCVKLLCQSKHINVLKLHAAGQNILFTTVMCGYTNILQYLFTTFPHYFIPYYNTYPYKNTIPTNQLLDGFGPIPIDTYEDPNALAISSASQIKVRLNSIERRADLPNASVGVTSASKRLMTSSLTRQGIIICMRILLTAQYPLKLRMWHPSYYSKLSTLRTIIAYHDIVGLKILLQLGKAYIHPDEYDLLFYSKINKDKDDTIENITETSNNQTETVLSTLAKRIGQGMIELYFEPMKTLHIQQNNNRQDDENEDNNEFENTNEETNTDRIIHIVPQNHTTQPRYTFHNSILTTTTSISTTISHTEPESSSLPMESENTTLSSQSTTSPLRMINRLRNNNTNQQSPPKSIPTSLIKTPSTISLSIPLTRSILSNQPAIVTGHGPYAPCDKHQLCHKSGKLICEYSLITSLLINYGANPWLIIPSTISSSSITKTNIGLHTKSNTDHVQLPNNTSNHYYSMVQITHNPTLWHQPLSLLTTDQNIANIHLTIDSNTIPYSLQLKIYSY